MGGGGKPGIAQDGGTDAAKIGEALEKGVEMVRERWGNKVHNILSLLMQAPSSQCNHKSDT